MKKILGITLSISFLLLFSCNDKKDACSCVDTYNKWESNGAGFGQHTSGLKNELSRCREKFDGINNAKKICNE